jgi:hypothetical protein
MLQYYKNKLRFRAVTWIAWGRLIVAAGVIAKKTREQS